MVRLVVTGANGFIGRALCDEALASGFDVCAVTRRAASFSAGIENLVIPHYARDSDLARALRSEDVLIHLAANAHGQSGSGAALPSDGSMSNVDLARHVAAASLRAGVKRFVYVSSAGVHGAHTGKWSVLTEQSPLLPHDDYTRSKLEAEQLLRRMIERCGMELVVIRPPLVYGARAPGSFAKLLNAIYNQMPIPFGAVQNVRVSVAVENLLSALLRCATHPLAAGGVFLVSDGEGLSTAEMCSCLAAGMDYTARIYAIPNPVLRGLSLLGSRGKQVGRLMHSLRIDSQHIQSTLEWKAPHDARDALIATARQYRVERTVQPR